jgi:hypothetical protein
LKREAGLDAFPEDRFGPDQPLDASLALGARLELRETVDRGALAEEGRLWRNPLRRNGVALGGRLESKEETGLGLVAQKERRSWRGQFLEGELALGGRLESNERPDLGVFERLWSDQLA